MSTPFGLDLGNNNSVLAVARNRGIDIVVNVVLTVPPHLLLVLVQRTDTWVKLVRTSRLPTSRTLSPT
ncbi:AIF_collapsed_G0053080.mRNA.1.CDS.1 [Saccharomyces cerevisiae]|nr:AIF_collapsed_G0053080.mRNA.1.CDS.1 [Saccharomyces cerevisiae]